MYLLTAPTLEVVPLADAKLAARIDGNAFDALVPGMVATGRQMAEQYCGRFFAEQTWRVELVDWPAATDQLPVHRATAVAINYWNGAAWVALADAAFAFFPVGLSTGIAPSLAAGAWPGLGAIAGGPRVRIDITAGDTDAAAVPQNVKDFITAHVAHWIANPEAASVATYKANPFLYCLLDHEKVWS